MDRDGLAALRDGIDLLLKCPDHVRAELVRWFAPEAAKGNGHDPHPPPFVKGSKVKARRGRLSTSAKTAERKLIAAMRDNPGLSVIALANAAGSSRSATGERLRQLAARGVVEKDPTGRWKLKGGDPGPQQPSPS
jgi:hypothetical protein